MKVDGAASGQGVEPSWSNPHELECPSAMNADQLSWLPVPADGSTADHMQDAQHPDSQAPALSSDEGPAAALEPQRELSPVEHFAQVVRSRAKWGPAVDVNVRGLMASAVLTGQPVHIQLRNKQPVYLQGQPQWTHHKLAFKKVHLPICGMLDCQ